MSQAQGPEVDEHTGGPVSTNIDNDDQVHGLKTTDESTPAQCSSFETVQQNEDLQQPRVCTSEDARQPITPPATPSMSLPNEKEWALRQVQKLKAEIEVLDIRIAERNNIVATFEQDLGKLKEEHIQNRHNKDQEIAKIEEEFDRKFDALKSTFVTLKASKQAELDGLKKSGYEVSRKKVGLMCYEELYAYLDAENEST